MFPSIDGAWLSKGGLVYIITQLDDRFTWRVVHTNGVVETGIGFFKDPGGTEVHAKWNFHEGDLKATHRETSGKVSSGTTEKIIWDDGDNFIQHLSL